jgi:deoxyhypusine synthase
MAEKSPSKTNGAVPISVADAVLVHGSMPAGSQKVEELDFNRFAGRPITVDDLMSGMNHMGFQASSIGEAVRIINDMVFGPSCYTISASLINSISEHGGMRMIQM